MVLHKLCVYITNKWCTYYVLMYLCTNYVLMLNSYGGYHAETKQMSTRAF